MAACSRCRGYLKLLPGVDRVPFELLTLELLALEELASSSLDAAARESGYTRPVGGGFRLELALPECESAEDLASIDFD